nr:uncharacterized protein LOC109174948 isoform X1 [Ipomoea batatas]
MAQSGGKNDTGNEPNASYSDANLTDDETQPVDSQCFAKGGDVKGEEAHNWLMMQNTLPVDNLLQCTDGFETQPINLYGETQVLELYDDTQVVEISAETQVVEIGGDTQVVYDHDGVEYIHTQLLDECNSEVATDSDCEGSDRTEILYETQEISDDDLKDNAKSMSCLNLQNTSLVEETDSGYKVRSDALNKEKHHSGPLHGGFTSIRIASMRASGLAAQSMAQIRTTGDSNKSNSSLELLTTKQDVPFVSRDFSNVEREVSKAHGWEDNAKHSKYVGNESRCKLGSSAVRRLFTEDTSDEIEKPEDGNNHAENGADLPQMFDSENALAGLSYLDSQEPGDESQANALEIVDRFLKFNAVECGQDIDLGKSVEKSVSVPSAKGTKSLAQRATRSTHEVGGIFDWDDNREDEGGGDFFQKNKDLLFDKKSSTVPRKPRRLDTDCVGKVEHPDSCKKKKDFSRSNSRVKSNIMRLNNESENPKSRNIFVKELNKQLIDMYDNGVADNKTANDVPDIPDVGLDTQMAAEAMQSLCFGGSLIEHQSITADLQNGSSKSGANNERQLRQSSSKKRIRSTRPATRQSLKTERTVATSVKSSENSKKQCDGELLETKRTRSNVRLQHAQKINRAEELKEESANRASNTDDFDRSLGAPSNGCRSLKKRPFNEQLGSLTPVAHRTRRRIVTNNQKCTGNTSDSSPEEINDLHSASTSDKSLPDDDARKTSTKDEFVTKLGNMDSAMFKSDQMAHPKGIRSRRTRASIARENYNQSNTRSSRTITNGSAPVDLSLRKRRCLTEENLMHKYSENGHAEDPNITDAADDIGGASIPNDVVNAKASKKCTRKSIMQGRNSVDAIKENGVEASPKDQSKTSASPSTTPINCMTPRNEASPICMGDEYRKRSCRRSMSGSSLIREINSLHTVGLPTASSVKDSRRRREMTNVRVLFSRHLDLDITKHQKKILTRLGASLASSMSDATHFVTDEFVRTRNILEAIAFGKPVVTHLWLESCAQACCLIDEKNYILRDAKKEREFGFSMPISLARASQHPLLQGHRVFITPNTKPGTDILAGLVKAVDGLPIERCGRSAMKDVTLADDILVLSCEDDYDLCVPFLEKGKTIYSSELLLNGIVTQKLEYERYQLFTDHFKKTRSTVWMKKKHNQNCPVTKSKS